MHIETVWENGVFRPLKRLTLKHTQITIEVPDEEIAANQPSPLPHYNLSEFPEEVQKDVARMRATREAIMAMPLPQHSPEETEEQEKRWRAFELRNEIRREQARPV